MNRRERQTLTRRIALGLIIGSMMMTSLAYAGDTVDITQDINDDVILETAAGSSDSDNVKNCTLNVSEGTVSASIYGGKTNTGSATGNTVSVSGGTFKSTSAKIYGGYVQGGNGVVNGNKVIITGGTFASTNVYGGCGKGSGDVVNNSVTIGSATDNKIKINDRFSIVSGGWASGNVSENTVTIYGGTVVGMLCGAYTTGKGSSAENNKVNIYGGIISSGTFYGAGIDADQSTVESNEVNIYGGNIRTTVEGGYAENGSAEGNKVNINGGTFQARKEESIIGGHVKRAKVDGVFTIKNNQVMITDGTFDKNSMWDIYGGQIKNNIRTVEVSDNTVTIGSAENNKITDKSRFNSVYGAFNGAGEVKGNTVTIYGGSVAKVYGAYRQFGKGNIEGNKVNINGGTFVGDESGDAVLYGAYLNNISNTNDDDVNDTVPKVTGNTVTITDGVFGEEAAKVYGAYVDRGTADAVGNAVTIGSAENNKITDEEQFGYVYGGYINGTGEAKGNTVTIYGGTFKTVVAGAVSTSADSTVNGNIVTIAGGDFTNADVYGGAVQSETEYTAVYGGADNANTLKFGTEKEGYTGTVKSIQGFDAVHFNSLDWTKDGTAVTTGLLGTSDSLQISVGTINVNSGTIDQGDSMTLIRSDNEIETTVNDTVTATVNQGIAASYENTQCSIWIGDDSKTIDLMIGKRDGAVRNDQVLVLGESRAAAMAFTNQGAELIELSMDALRRTETDEDMQVFASAYANASEYETGSHVKVNGYSGIVGIGKKNDSGVNYGVFFENGTGNYSTHNILSGEYMRGDGEATYNGGGIFVRKDNKNGIYVEGAVRAGNLSNKLDRAVRSGDHLTGYDINTLYYGAQIGVGKIIPIGSKTLDVYGKFLYTHHDSERFDIEGTDMYFDSVTSQRLRLGARMNHEQNSKLNLYYGASWEYEFDGDAQDRVDEFDLDTPSLAGSTLIGELGLNYRASDKWAVDLNFRGYGGQRDGYSGSIYVNCAF